MSRPMTANPLAERHAARATGAHVLVAAVFLALVPTASSGAADSLVAQFRQPLVEALQAISISLDDLTFRTDYADRDTFRLALMDTCFRDPVGGLDRMSRMSAALGGVSAPQEVIDRARPWLDLEAVSPPEVHGPDLLEGRSLFVRSANALWAAMDRADAATRRAFSGLSDDERRMLWGWSLTTLREGEDEGGDGAGGRPAPAVNIYSLRRKEEANLVRTRRMLALAAKVDRALILGAARDVYAAAWDVATLLGGMTPKERAAIRSVTVQTPLGRAAIGRTESDHYAGPYALIIDPGGDDEYRIRPPAGPFARTVSVIIDVAGDDRYEGTVAAGLFGVGLLVELAGDDIYTGDSWTQGAACFGAGVLWDAGGRDTYRAAQNAQGAGTFGIAALVDLAGSDVYRIGSYGQALGGTAGVGIIEDRAGSDAYISGGAQVDVLRYEDHDMTMAQGVGIGLRPLASGGIGILSDRRGNDTYVADIFGQGTAYWLGIGALVDDAGHDRYTAYQYAQGAGIHLAAAYLIDRAGHDLYSSNGVSQGCGHDLATGILFDQQGDDSYVTEGLSLGGGNANAISLLVDMAGDDGYIARRPDALGYSDQRRDYGMIGVMLDLAGKDRYGAPWGADSTWWTHSTYGVGVDRPWTKVPPAPRQPDRGRGKTPEEVQAELAHAPDSLFVQASNPVAAYGYLVEPAQEALASRGPELVGFWADKLGSEIARERQALITIHEKLFARGDTSDVAMLVDSLRSRVGATRRLAAYLLGFAPTKAPIRALIPALSHEDWKTRESAAEGLWRLSRTPPGAPRQTTAQAALVVALGDSVALVRHAAALALETAGDEASDGVLVVALEDSSQIVRYSAERALATHPTAALFLADLIRRDTTYAATHALRAIRRDSTYRAELLPVVIAALGTDRPWPIRAAAAATIEAWRATEARAALAEALATADHPYLRQRLNAALAALPAQAPAVPRDEPTSDDPSTRGAP